jgi:hypothetical protein
MSTDDPDKPALPSPSTYIIDKIRGVSSLFHEQNLNEKISYASFVTQIRISYAKNICFNIYR